MNPNETLLDQAIGESEIYRLVDEPARTALEQELAQLCNVHDSFASVASSPEFRSVRNRIRAELAPAEKAVDVPERSENLPAIVPRDPVTQKPLGQDDRVRTHPRSSEAFSNADWLPGEFWDEAPALKRIFDISASRSLSPDAVLGCVLCRIAATIPASVRIPAFQGSEAPINPFALIRGVSGDGKSSAAHIAEELVPFDAYRHVKTIARGSGEGIVEAFLMKDKDSGEKVPSGKAIFATIDEGSSFVETAGRTGSTAISTLLTLRTGGDPGSVGASGETTRSLATLSYRFAAVMNVQPDVAVEFLEYKGLGLPQRFALFNAAKLRWQPVERDLQPVQPLDIRQSDWGVSSVTYPNFADEVVSHIGQLRRLESLPMEDWTPAQRQDYDDGTLKLAGHELLNTITLATVLMLLNGADSVDEKIFGQAQQITDVSARLWRRADILAAQSNKRQGAGERDAAVRGRRASDLETYWGQACRSMENFLRKEGEVKVLKSAIGKSVSGKVRRELRELGWPYTPNGIVDRAIEDGVIVERDGAFELPE